MSLRRPAKDQPEIFEFNASSLEAAKVIVAKYPEGKQQSAVMALLYIAQKQNNNWIPLAAMKYIAKFLDMSKNLAMYFIAASGIQLLFCF